MIKLITDMRQRYPDLGMIELWHRMRQRGYNRCPERLYRTIRKLNKFPKQKPRMKYVAKPYEAITHAGERWQVNVKVVPKRCIADPELKLSQYTAIDGFSRLRFLYAYPEQSTDSSADFAKRALLWHHRRGIKVECIQTDNGFEFTNRFSNNKRDIPTLFEATLASKGICHKLIRPYTARNSGKVERSHREDQKRFSDNHSFYSLADFGGKLAANRNRSNNIPMRPLHWLSPRAFLRLYNVQHV